jgi:putative ABC transport system permease protein
VPLFSWFILRRIARERLRSGLTIAGIALGIAVVIGIRLANTSSIGGFAAALETLTGAASLEVSAPGGVDEERLAELPWLGEFGDVAPVIEADAVMRAPGGGTETVKVLGIDVLRDRAIRAFRVTGGPDGGEPSRPLDLLALLTDPDAVILTASLAQRHALQAGTPIELVTGDTRRRFFVRGLLTHDEAGRPLDSGFAVMDIATAQWAFGRFGRIDRIDLRLSEGTAIADAERAIAARLPVGLAVGRPERRGEQVEQMLRAFHFNLAALSYVALLVGLFLIYNTISTSVIARRQEIGMLRALGTSRRTIATLFLTEAAALGAAGIAVGLAGGALLAYGAVQLTGATVSALYVADVVRVPSLQASDVALAVAVGLTLSLAASAAPAIEAARVPPLAAIRGTDRLDTGRFSRRALGGGVVLIAAAAGLSRPGPVEGLPVFGLLAALAVLLGTALLVPSALQAAVYGSARLLPRTLGVEGLLAHANVAAGARRLAVSIAALTVSVSMLVAIAVMIGSFRETVVYWIGQTLQSDLYVSAGGRAGLDSPPTISEEVEALIRSHPSVVAVDPVRGMTATYAGRPIVLRVAHLEQAPERGALLFKDPANGPDLTDAARRQLVLVSEPFALRHRVTTGDELRLDSPSGPHVVRVAGVYYDYSTDRGVVAMDWEMFRARYGDFRPTNLAIELAPGASPDEVRTELGRRLDERHVVFIHTSATLRQTALRIFDRTFSVTYALEAIAILVGMLGVAVTLLTLIVERRQDFTTLRLLGAARRQIRLLVLIEAAFIGVLSQALGLIAGLALALLLVYVINVQSFGWTIQFDVPVVFLLQSSAALSLAALAAGFYPARVAGSGRLQIREDE